MIRRPTFPRLPQIEGRRIGAGIAALITVAGLMTACGSGSNAGNAPAKPKPQAHLVELATAKPDRLAYAADRAGGLRALREARIVNREEGLLTAVRVQVSDRVAAGAVLARYDQSLLAAQYDKAQVALRQAEVDLARNKRLVEQNFVSADALSRATTAVDLARADVRLLATRLQHMTLTAPFAGVVSARLVEPGEVTPQHTHLLTVIDPSTLVTDVNVSELVLPQLHVGDAAEVRIDALGDTLHRGRILRVHPAIDPATRTGRVEVALNPVPPSARAGQFCRVQFAVGSQEQVVVPLVALRRDADGEFVYVHQADGTVRRQAVSSGLRLADRVEVRTGVTAGTAVVVKGFLGLAPGLKVKAVTPPPATAVAATAAKH